MRSIATLERSQLYALAWRGLFGICGLLTLIIASRSLSLEAQGYYFTFESIAFLRVVAELGLSQVILQVASHECAFLTIDRDKAVSGDIVARARLAQVLRTALRLYAVIGVLLWIVLSAGGVKFFAGVTSDVSWKAQWLTLSFFVALHFTSIVPAMAMLEGLGQVAEVMKVRVIETLVSYVALWTVLALGGALWALPVFYITSFTVQFGWLILRRRRLLGSIWQAYDGKHFQLWRSEVLPFQWRLGVSWLSGYLVFQLLNPLVFRLSSPSDAGRLGMSLMTVQGILTIGISVMRAKAPALGNYIAKGDRIQVNKVWKRGFWQSVILTAIGATTLLLVLGALQMKESPFAYRVMPLFWMTVLAVATVINSAAQAISIYLRAYKEEPLMVSSIGVAIFSIALNIALIPKYGSIGACVVFLAIAIVNCLWTARVLAVKSTAPFRVRTGEESTCVKSRAG